MRSTLHSLALTLLLTCSTLLASADTFDFSFSNRGYDDNGNPVLLSAIGELTTSLTSPGIYTVIAVNGTTNGQTIAGLSSGYGSDNELFFPPAGGGYLDTGGITYALDGGGLVNLYFNSGSYREYDYSDSFFATGPLTIVPAIPTPVAPEPSTPALVSSGVLALGILLCAYRNRIVDVHIGSSEKLGSH